MKFSCDLVLLDLGNVLVKFDHAIIARKLSKLSRVPIFSIVPKFIQSGLGEQFDLGKITAEKFVARVICDLRLKISAEEFVSAWNEIFTENPGMDALVEKLAARYPVYVISDTNSFHFEYVQKHFPVLRHVKEFILSYKMGVRKPHPKIFEEAVRRAGTSAAKTLFADDRREIIDAASRMGFHAFQFTDTDSFKKHLFETGLLE